MKLKYFVMFMNKKGSGVWVEDGDKRSGSFDGVVIC